MQQTTLHLYAVIKGVEKRGICGDEMNTILRKVKLLI